MMCGWQGKSLPKLRSKLLQLGSGLFVYVTVCRYLLYLSKILYNPTTLLWRIYCDNNATLVGLAGLTVVCLLSSALTLMRPSLLVTVTVLSFWILVSLIEDIPIIKSRNLLKCLPCRGLVMKSATISLVGHHSILTSFMLTLSVMKKYQTLMCRVCLPLGDPVDELPANCFDFFEPANLHEKIARASTHKKPAGDEVTIKQFHQSPYSPPPLTFPFVKQYHSHYKGIGIFSRRYGITHGGGDAVASAKLV